jgi:hypothetical protein
MLLTPIPIQHARPARILKHVLLLQKLLVRESGGGRVRLDVDVVTALFGLPGEELKFLNGSGVTGVTGEVVTGEDGL